MNKTKLKIVGFTIMNKIVILLFLAVLGSCIVETEQEPLPNDNLYFLEINNRSSHKIEIERYNSNGGNFAPFALNSQQDTVIFDYYEEVPIVLFHIFSYTTKVIYDDDVSIIHTREEQQLASRSLFLPASYTGGKASGDQYIYTYEFTDADYDEAVALGG